MPARRKGRTEGLDPQKARTYPLKQRKNLVSVKDACGPIGPGMTVGSFMDSVPDILAGRDLKKIVAHICEARRAGRPLVVAIGGHVIKVGLGPLICDLIDRGVVTAVAMNGAAAIHDLEMALIGETSEDVADGIEDGTFGMANETGTAFAEASLKAAKDGGGLGAALAEWLISKGAPHAEVSILCRAARANVPCTVHVSIGADIVHMHPKMDGAATGKATMNDFHILTSVVGDLEGGVYINLGSAALMPEVFLKALNLARNLGRTVRKFTTVNMDMIQHYRPRVNVVQRPTKTGGEGFALTGHHEIMFPLLAAAVLDGLGKNWRPIER